MKTDTDKMRERFESWYACNAHDYEQNPIGSRDCGLQWKAYQQGQRDLIEAMEQYTTIMKDGTPLYRLPEDTQK